MKQLTCINCDADFEPESLRRVLYCSGRCRETAKVIRFIRGAYEGVTGEQWLDENIELAIKVKLGSVDKGGYPRERQLSEATRQAVFDRDKKTCQVCGKPGNEIHHLTNDPEVLNEPSYLQTICRSCHLRISNDALVPTDDPEIKMLIRDIKRRAKLREPERECDDNENWSKRRPTVEKERRALLRDMSYASIREYRPRKS